MNITYFYVTSSNDFYIRMHALTYLGPKPYNSIFTSMQANYLVNLTHATCNIHNAQNAKDWLIKGNYVLYEN